jgi:hypothetical protein
MVLRLKNLKKRSGSRQGMATARISFSQARTLGGDGGP